MPQGTFAGACDCHVLTKYFAPGATCWLPTPPVPQNPPPTTISRKPLYSAYYNKPTADIMDPRPHEYILEVFADQTFVKDIVKGSRDVHLLMRVLPLSRALSDSQMKVSRD